MNAVIACHTCGLVQQLTVEADRRRPVKCARCGTTLRRYRKNARARTAALALAALFLYLPANIYPILVMEYAGKHTESTVWGGVVKLFQEGVWFVAIIIFCASILIPLLKLLGLLFLVTYSGVRWQRERTLIYKIITVIGPWAMLDVFLLAVAVAVIRFGKFATVIPGPGVISFTAVVVLTILASSNFDSRLIWEEEVLNAKKTSRIQHPIQRSIDQVQNG